MIYFRWQGGILTISNENRGEIVHPPNEELAHAITHGVGAVLSMAGLAVLVVFASLRGDAWHVVAASIYGASLLTLYLCSTFYHALPPSRAKQVFQTLDHGAIYILIAGTYTPFTLVTLRGGWGWSLFGVIWGLAVLGVIQEVVLKRRIRWVSLLLYLGMGWLIMVAVRPLVGALDTGGLILLSAGGLFYTLGTVFYMAHRIPYHHAIWHLFVLAGSICHFFAVLRYVIPPA